MEMQAEVLGTLAIVVPLMAFIYSLHRGQRRRFELLEQRMDRRFDGMDQRFDALEQRMDRRFAGVDQRFDALEQRMDRRFAGVDQRFDGMHGRIDALARPQIKLVNR